MTEPDGEQDGKMVSIPRAVVYVDLNILEENYRLIHSRVPAKVKILCVVKADAYGHGGVEVARRLESAGVDYLGVATSDEGVDLRNHGISTPILVMSGILPWDETEPVFDHRLTPVVHNFQSLDRIIENRKGSGEDQKIHIKIDTGMGRLGFVPADIPLVVARLEAVSGVKVEGLMSHFAASEKRDEYGLNQIADFTKAVTLFREGGIFPEYLHMANSGAITNYPEAYFDMVRLGISLYGSHPSRGLEETLPVRQVMRYVAKIALVREFPPGYALSYGGMFVTERSTRVAYVPSGYADGYPRALSNRAAVLIKNQRCSIVGRICMDWLLVDVTDLEDVAVEDEVILLGEGDRDAITADELAELAGTIPYEILCKISKRLERVYV